MQDSNLGGKPIKPVVNVLPPGESTITAKWTQPFFSTACDVAFGENKDNLLKVGVFDSGLWSIPLTDLDPEKVYYIKVRGFNSLRTGDWSDPVPVRRPKLVTPQPVVAPQPTPPQTPPQVPPTTPPVLPTIPIPTPPPASQPTPVRPESWWKIGAGIAFGIILAVMIAMVAMCLRRPSVTDAERTALESATAAMNNANLTLGIAKERDRLATDLAAMQRQPATAPTVVNVSVTNTTVIVNNQTPTSAPTVTERVIYVQSPVSIQQEEATYFDDSQYGYQSYVTYPAWSVNFGIGNRYTFGGYHGSYGGGGFRGGGWSGSSGFRGSHFGGGGHFNGGHR